MLRTLTGITVFWLGLSVVGDAFATVVVSQRLAQLVEPGRLASAIGVVTFVGIVAGMLVQPLAGAVSDALRPRWGRRGQVLIGAVAVAATLAAFVGAEGVLAVAVAFVLVQLAGSVAQAAQQGFIPDLVPRGWRGRASGLKGMADLGGAFVGFAVIAALAGPDLGPALAVIAAVVVATALLAAVLVRPAERSTSMRRPTADWSDVRDEPAIEDRGAFARVVAARFLFLLGIFVVGRFFVLLVAERLGIDPTAAVGTAAGLLAGLTLVTALASPLAGWLADRLGRVPVMLGGALLGATGAAMLLAATTPAQILVFASVMGLGSAAFGGANWALAADLVPSATAGRMLGFANFGTAGAAAVAGLFGPLIDVVRPEFPGLGFGGFVVVAVGLFVLSALVVVSIRGTSASTSPIVSRAEP